MVGEQIFQDRPGSVARCRSGGCVPANDEGKTIDLEVAQWAFRATENAGKIEPEFHSRRRAIDLERLTWLAAHAQISNNHWSQKRRFDLAQLQAQSFPMSGALCPHPQSAGDDERSETDRE